MTCLSVCIRDLVNGVSQMLLYGSVWISLCSGVSVRVDKP